VTHYRTVRRLPWGTLVECRLETGRRNQIRAHLAEIGCPIVGDRKYGYRPSGASAHKRPLLHAWRLRFRHPLTGTEVTVEAAVPAGFPSIQE
jgi:23S rRNA pseudouridine1911/1915/1917 synthase